MVEQAENVPEEQSNPGSPTEPKKEATAKRVYSEVEFPYIDLEQALTLAQAIHEHAGSSCQDKELAAWLNQSADGGTYKARRSAARMFGLIEIQAGTLTLTGLGRDACDNIKGRLARADAFLKPELYHILYDAFGGHALPPAPAIERRIEQAGVSSKQKERARQAFNKSAIFAGYIDQTTGRFVRPGVGGGHEERHEPEDKGKGGGGDPPDGELHPFILGLLKTLPTPDSEWPLPERAKWLNTANSIFGLIYKDGKSGAPGFIEVTYKEL